jgi:hypothetical protein
VKHTDQNSQDYPKIAQAAEKLKKMADDCNADSRMRQNEARMTKFRETLDGFDISKLGTIGNYIIMEKDVSVSVGKSSTRHKLLAVLLMDHIVLAKASKGKEKLQFKFLIRLDLAFIDTVDASESDEPEFPFSIDVLDESNTAERFIFWETSNYAREAWINEIKPRTTSVGLSSSWRAQRHSDWRKSARIQTATPHPLMRATQQTNIPLVDMLRRSSTGAPESSDPVTSPSSTPGESPVVSPTTTPRSGDTKKRKADSGTVRKVGKVLGEAVNLQGDQLAVLESPKDQRRQSSRREKLGGIRAMSVMEKPGQLRRGRSRSFGDDVAALKLGLSQAPSAGSGNSTPRAGVPSTNNTPRADSNSSSIANEAKKKSDEIKKSSSMSSAADGGGDKRFKMVVQTVLDDLYQARSAVSVGNKADAKFLISKLINQLEQFQTS